MIIVAFRTAWQPFFLKIANDPKAKEVYSRVLTYFSLMGVFVVVSVSYLIEYLVQIPLPGSMTLLGNAYWEGIKIIPVILTAYFLFGLYVNFTVGIYIRKKTKWMILFTGVAAIVNVSSNFYLMPAYGIMGAAIATLLSYLVMMILIFFVNNSIYPINYDYKRIAFLLVYLGVMLWVYYFVHPEFLFRLVLLVASPLLFWVSGFFKKSEINAVVSLFRKA
jgi:O-antigen/teichoic acid export membrane protein